MAAANDPTLEQIAHEFVEELLRDRAFKAEILAALRAALVDTVRALKEPDPRP